MRPLDFPSRISSLSRALAAAGIDAYLGTRRASLHYLGGAFAPWRGAVLVTSSGDAKMIYWAMDSDRVYREGWGLPVVEWGGANAGFIETAGRELKVLGLAKGRIALDISIAGTGQDAPGLLFAHEMASLRELLPEASLENGSAHIDSLMLLKTPEELERLQIAAHAADAGFAAGLQALEPGVTENSVAGAIEEAIRLKGSTWSWSITGGTEVGSGERTAFLRGVTQQATEKRIGKNEFVILDLHPMVDLYLADLGLPVFMGKPDSAQQRLIDCWEETVDVLLTGIRPGRQIGDVCREGLAVFAKYGLQDFGLPMFGHGLGTCARLGPSMNPKNTGTLSAGMVMALGTHLYMPGLGGLRLEYPTAVTEAGAEPLCRTAARVVIKP